MKSHVTTIIENFEAGKITEADALTALQKTTGRIVDADWLRHYWRSESVEDFVDRLCAQPIEDWQRITDSDAVTLLVEFFQTESQGRRDSIMEALDRRFGKPRGTLSGLIYRRDMTEPVKILDELKQDTRIYL